MAAQILTPASIAQDSFLIDAKQLAIRSVAILCIDDDPFAYSTLGLLLGELQLQTLPIAVATDVSEIPTALAELHAYTFEHLLMICDRLLPRIIGYCFLQNLEQEYHAALTVALTGKVSSTHPMLQSGKRFSYLPKPWQ